MTDSTSQTPEISGKPSPILIVFLIFPILGILAAVALALSSGVAANTPVPTPESITLQQTSLIDKPAPNFELASLDGPRQRLSSYRGRTVFINFWATWCEPCKRELPAFMQFQAESKRLAVAPCTQGAAPRVNPCRPVVETQTLPVRRPGDLSADIMLGIRPVEAHKGGKCFGDLWLHL